ncbi:MAG TPA: tetratricopeptide repeat protein [Candidatus Nitrosotenuis sp.]|jgi:tetratricopeptide (TPR) repeat protein|nr:tetratricopeptide repeat protein [Candidatus Nitrosotenuis sp.]
MVENVTLAGLAEALKQGEDLLDRGLYEEALELLNRTRQALPAGADPREESLLHHLLGVALTHLERAPEAAPRFRRSLQLAEAAQDLVGQARATEQLAANAHARRAFQEALVHYQRAHRLWQKVADREGEARTLRGLGNVYVDLDQSAAALQAYREARALFKELGKVEEVAPCIIHSAMLLYGGQGRQAALAELTRGLEEDGCEHYLVLNNLGFLHTLEGDLERAADLLQRAQRDVQSRGVDDDDAALVLLNLGNLQALRGHLAEAEVHLKEAAARFERFPSGRAIEIILQANEKYRDQGFEPFLVVNEGLKEAVAHLNLGTVHAWQGRLDEALARARQGVELDREHPYPYLCLGWIHLARGEEAQALGAFHRARGMEPDNPHYRQAQNLLNPYLEARVGRNDPCPCGSGKKFKKCHGAL